MSKMGKLSIALCISVALTITMVPTVLAKKKVTLRVAHSWPAERLPGQVEFDKEFMKKHPDIVIKRENIPWSDYKQKIMIEAAAGTAPDIFYMQDSWSLKWISEGMLLNLESLIKGDEEFNRGLFYPEALGAFIWKGDLYGFPYDWNVCSGTLAYNIGLFDTMGLPYPDKSWTLEGEFLETAKKLTKDTNDDGKIDQWGWVGRPTGYTSNVGYLYPFGGRFVNEDETECLMIEPGSVRAVEFWADLILKYEVSPTVAVQEALINPWYSGKIGMCMSYSWCKEWNKFTKFKWDIAHAPEGPAGRFASGGGSGYGINRTCKNLDEAWTYFREYLSFKGVTGVLSLCFGSPARKAAWEAYAAKPDLPKHNNVFREAMEEYVVMERPISPPSAEAWKIFTDEMDLVALGKKAAAEACTTIKEKTDPLFAENK